MVDIAFEGQQEGERILYIIRPHVFSKYIAIGKILILAVFFYLILLGIGSIIPAYASLLQFAGLGVSLLLVLLSFWWNQKVYRDSKTFVTDRRIHRIDVVSPFFETKRTLFWNEALKAKAYAPNLLYRMLSIGTVQVEPHLSDQENVKVVNASYFEDLANYIDKILYVVKNKPEELSSLHAFVPKPRGARDLS